MKKKESTKRSGELSFRPVVKYIIYFYVIIVIAMVVLCVTYSISAMQEESNFAAANAKTRIDSRIGQTVTLLEALAKDPFYSDMSQSFEKKAAILPQYSDQFGYLMVCILDKNINVYDESGVIANLGDRAYLQTLYSTGELQVTDSFAAGLDGVTLNYTIAVPIMAGDEVTGCLFAAIYFDEIEAILKSSKLYDSQSLYLFGSENQVMSIPDVSKYGESFLKLTQATTFLSTTAQKTDEAMYDAQSGNYWGFQSGNLIYASYHPIQNTYWTILSKVSFFGVFQRFIPQMLVMFLISTAICVVLVFLAKRYVNTQMATVEMLVSSVQELEKKIYQNEKPDNVDFKEIISLTSKGLTDGLTGVITRTVFLNQIPNKLKSLSQGKYAALCFVDVDNLKTINDTYGHAVGDMTLKNVGYILREYEKKHEGLVGRHGGDEFLLLVTDFDSRETLENLLEQLTLRLHAGVSNGDMVIQTQCSIGVAICDSSHVDVDQLIEQADKALYFVKQNGKGFHKIFSDK